MLRSLLILALIGIATDSAAQQPAKVGSFGPWTVECRQDRMTDKKECTVLNLALGGKGAKFDGSIAVHEGGNRVVVMIKPSSKSLMVRVDKNAAETFDCKPSGCELGGANAAALSHFMTVGEDMLLRAVPKDAPVDVEMKTKGFAEALRLARTNLGMPPEIPPPGAKVRCRLPTGKIEELATWACSGLFGKVVN